MMKQVKDVFQFLYFKAVPSVRKQFCTEMKKKGYTQYKISQVLNIKEATVSQYVNKKRAVDDDVLDKNLKKEILFYVDNTDFEKDSIKRYMEEIIFDLVLQMCHIYLMRKNFKGISMEKGGE